MMRSPRKELVDYGDGGSSDSDSGSEGSRCTRAKRFKKPLEESVDEVDLDPRKRNNGRQLVSEPLLVHHQKLEPEIIKTNEDIKNSQPIVEPITENRDVAPPTVIKAISYTDSATDIMRQMGFDKNSGMGKFMNDYEMAGRKLEQMDRILQEGRVVIDESCINFNLEEELTVEEEIKWIAPTLLDHALDFNQLYNSRRVGPRKTTIRNEVDFVDPAALNKLCVLRKCFAPFNDHEYQQLRARSNPFESIDKGPFICRAGMKLANLDAATSYALTQPTTNSNEKQSVLGPNDLFYFADVCAGPGGFSEYILFRKKWGAKGFGLTLKGKLDFDVGSFSPASPAESFEPFYGPGGKGDGNIYNPVNTAAFINHVISSTDGRGVHLMMADGGFDVDNKELTEIMSAQISLSQCYLALELVRTGGMFVCKFFDTLTPFTVGLLYLMYLSFDLVAIHKPKTSRPANSERYLVCKWKREDTGGILEYLKSSYQLYWKWTVHHHGDLKEDILELVPKAVMTQNKEFYEYILRQNTLLVSQQVEYLERMVIFARNPELKDHRHEMIKKKCFDFWKVPATSNRSTAHIGADQLFQTMAGNHPTDYLDSQDFILTPQLDAAFRSPYDWRVVVIEANHYDKNRGFYLSLGQNRVYRYEGKQWVHIMDKLELCRETLVYGEFVDEIYGKKPSQITVRTFHIIDAMILGGIDVRSMHYTTRHEVCIKFAKAMNKPSRPELCQIRAKIPVRMENMGDIFEKLENRIVSGNSAAQLVAPVDHTDEMLPFIKPAGILFLKITKDPWTMALSRSSNRKYYFNTATGASSYDLIPESISSFQYTMQNRVIWWWDKDLKNIMGTQEVTATEGRPIIVPPGTVNPQALLRFVRGEWQMNRTGVMRRLSSSSSNHSSS